ncbi:MAG: molybdenum cofactor guanylyltransferase [Planctomycetota bacterium]|jgi:molybdopterin-guanine dinucleotide biosynthesis protein A
MNHAYLLAGGRSRRFGSDKARVLIQGIPLARFLADDLEQLGWRVAVVAQRVSDYDDLGLPVVADIHPDGGPLAGLLTALGDCQSSGSLCGLIVNCDLIPRTWDWLGPAHQRWRDGPSSIVVLRSDPFMPMPGLYAATILDVATRLWQEGKRSLRDVHEELRGSIASLDWPIDKLPRSFNTPEELQNILDEETNR